MLVDHCGRILLLCNIFLLRPACKINQNMLRLNCLYNQLVVDDGLLSNNDAEIAPVRSVFVI
jgi:hypothetical protein